MVSHTLTSALRDMKSIQTLAMVDPGDRIPLLKPPPGNPRNASTVYLPDSTTTYRWAALLATLKHGQLSILGLTTRTVVSAELSNRFLRIDNDLSRLSFASELEFLSVIASGGDVVVKDRSVEWVKS